MDAALLNEGAADKQVIKSLFSEIERLKRKMLKIVKTTDGKYYRVRPEDELNEQEVTEAVAEASANLDALKAIAPADQPTPAIAEAQGNADAPVAPAEPVPPAAPADPPVAPPVAPPVDQPTAPADPAAVTLS